MAGNRPFLAFLILMATAVCGSAAGDDAVQIRNGVLRRLWDERLLDSGSVPQVAVERFLAENRSLLGLAPSSRLRLDRAEPVALGQRYRYLQTAWDLPVFGAELTVVADGGRLRTLFSALSTVQFPPPDARLAPDQALHLALEATDTRALAYPETVDLGYTFEGVLIYRVRFTPEDPPAAWEVWVEARTGTILRQEDLRVYVDGTGRIFDPDPKTATNDNSLQDEGDANSAIPPEAYDTVTLTALNSPVGGWYTLDGPFVSTSATANRAQEASPDFLYWRQDDRFEEVMVYYHIDREQRYFQNDLLTFNANNTQQVCNVNGTPEDNSWYNPQTRIITYGYGGVDDAEDADVILHEYGHAVHFDINPAWGGGHCGAMGEGFGDYLAGSYSLTRNPAFQPDWVFNWDGHNQFWAGRILNAPYHYPDELTGDIYHDGALWSAALVEVWWDMPDRIAWDRIVLQHHFLIGPGALMSDAAQAILATELALYDGLYRELIVDHFGARGLVNPEQYYPAITHEPLPDTEDTLQVEFEVLAAITSALPLDTTSLALFWRAGAEPYSSASLAATGTPGEYRGIIPGPFNSQMVSYYLTAADTLGLGSFSPPGAPAEAYQFYVGPDPQPPEIAWVDSLGETIMVAASLPVRAVVRDNLGVQSVEIGWRVGDQEWQFAPMNPVAADTFLGTLAYSIEELGQTVYYLVRAVDASSVHNQAESATQFFTINGMAHLDDFEGPLGPWIISGNWGATAQYAVSGTHSLEDSPGTLYPPNTDTWAEWGQVWDLSVYTHATLSFFERHLLEEGHDWGRLEICADGGPWEPLLQVTGIASGWTQREVPLDPYCAGQCQELRFRFRVTSDAQQQFHGWFIDDLEVMAELVVPVAPGKAAPLPADYALGAAHPNPFNPETVISYKLKALNYVQLKVYDTAGREVRTLVDGWKEAGAHEVTLDGTGLASGVYLVRMEAGDFVQTRKVILLK
ncbi:MAG: T9SS C-terminal target domain-containing protein [Candidatus Zixiibacteriota bacterium]|nr:MAG: T9SS C-terminal target domain-containing protein [candidate division Zixibacteria bacterium]